MRTRSRPIAKIPGAGKGHATPLMAQPPFAVEYCAGSRQFDAWLRASAGYQRLTCAPITDTDASVPGYLTLDLRYAHKLGKAFRSRDQLAGRNLVGGDAY